MPPLYPMSGIESRDWATDRPRDPTNRFADSPKDNAAQPSADRLLRRRTCRLRWLCESVRRRIRGRPAESRRETAQEPHWQNPRGISSHASPWCDNEYHPCSGTRDWPGAATPHFVQVGELLREIRRAGLKMAPYDSHPWHRAIVDSPP